jgi:hypothetical protein
MTAGRPAGIVHNLPDTEAGDGLCELRAGPKTPHHAQPFLRGIDP